MAFRRNLGLSVRDRLPTDGLEISPVTALFWICATTGLTLISGLSEYRRWQWAAGVMETLEKS